MSIKRRNTEGFTLLEIVVAVAIFAVISGIIFPALLQFLEMRERIDEKHRQITGLQKTFLFLANDLRYAVNRLSKDEYGEIGKTTLALDDNGLIEFTTAHPDLNLGGLNVPRRVRWQLEEGVLQRFQSPVMDPESDTRSFVQSLLENVSNVEIEVSRIEDGRNSSSSKWDEQTRLPDLIEIVVELENNLEYRRIFSMLGADNRAAVSATATSPPGDQDAEGAGDGQDTSGDQAPGSPSNTGGTNSNNSDQDQGDG